MPLKTTHCTFKAAVCKIRQTKVWQNHCDNQRYISLYIHTIHLHIYTWFDFCGNIKTWLRISFSTTWTYIHDSFRQARSWSLIHSCPSAVLDEWEGLILTPLQISSRCVRDFTSFPSDGSISLLPQRHTITGTNLFGVFETSRRSGRWFHRPAWERSGR